MKDAKLVATRRCIAFAGPQGAGKTSLIEALLHAAGAIPRKGSVKDGNSLLDHGEEARQHQMTTELGVASFDWQEGHFTFLDCPGSVELAQDAQAALLVADLVVVVAEPDPARANALSPLLHLLDAHAIPHILFVNKIDHRATDLASLVAALQAHSARPLLLRQIPIREGEHVTGYVDLVSERAYKFEPGKPSALIQLPEKLAADEKAERTRLLEGLADFDDGLLEQLLEDSVPPAGDIFDQLHRDIEQDLVVPVMLGAAESESGIHRLLKSLRHDAPDPTHAAARLGITGGPAALVFRTWHQPHAGKLSLARVFGGAVRDGDSFGDARISGIQKIFGASQSKQAEAGDGAVAGLGRLDSVATGQLLAGGGHAALPAWPAPPPAQYGQAVAAESRDDEIKLTAALEKLVEEDPSLCLRQDAELGQLLLSGQGVLHLRLAQERLARRNKLKLAMARPATGYKETIRKSATHHARHKKQSGGHGQFGDVHLEIRPQPRGAGFSFVNAIVGGAIPRQFIPGVEHGVAEYLKRGPLGYPVVDIEVKLFDGQFHAVDSSDQAFRAAAQLGMREAMPQCDPVLLEPVHEVALLVPADFTSAAQRLLSGRRGQILGFAAREGWPGWDQVTAWLPEAELHDLVNELRSLTQGLGSYTTKFDHLQELTGRQADEVIAQRKAQLEAA